MSGDRVLATWEPPSLSSPRIIAQASQYLYSQVVQSETGSVDIPREADALLVVAIPPDLKLRRMERKYVLKRAVKDLLPASFLQRRKMGFSAPLAVWFRNELRPFVEDTLSIEAIRSAGVFRHEVVRRMLDDHFARRANYDNQIWALIPFTHWHHEYIAGWRSPEREATSGR